MPYYDHATLMIFKLGPWEDSHSLRNFEREAEYRARLTMLAHGRRGPTRLISRLLGVLGLRK